MKKVLFKNDLQMYLYIIIFCLLLIGFIYFGNKDYHKNQSEPISVLSNIDEDNVYDVVNISDAYNYVKSKNVIILFTSNSEISDYYANIVNKVAKENQISSIYFCNIENDRNDNNASYESITLYLKDYLYHVDNRKVDIYGPTLIIKKDSKFILVDNSYSIIKGNNNLESVFNDYSVNELKSILNEAFKDYNERI